MGTSKTLYRRRTGVWAPATPSAIGPHQRPGLLRTQGGPASHQWEGPTPRPPYQGTPRAGKAPTSPNVNFSWLTKREAENLGVQLARELKIQPWPKQWQRKGILREHLRKIDPPADVLLEQWFTSTGPARWQGSVMTKTQKRRMQRLDTDARNNGVAAQRPRPKPRQERPIPRHNVASMHHNTEAGSFTMPHQKKTPIIQSVTTKLASDTVRLELDTRLKAPEAAVRRSQQAPTKQEDVEGFVKVARCERWPPWNDEEVLTPSSVETEAEEKKTRTNAMLVDTDRDGTSPVRATKKEPQVKLVE